jgi:hypothetical protein
MAKDTTELLHRALEAAEQWEGAPAGSPEERAAAETATGSLTELHEELRRGGHLPAAWCNAQPPVPVGNSSGAGY